MAGVFINYRRDDAKSEAGRLFDWLSHYFGKGQIFMDVSGSIEPGLEFDRVIDNAVGSCDALIVIIGKQWVTVRDENGKRRLDDPHDFVRLEIGAALKRDIRVIPVLVQGAAMPAESDLPDDLKRLAKRQATEISDNRWEYDTGQLVKVLEKAGVRPQPAQTTVSAEHATPLPAQPAKKKMSGKAIAGIVVAGVVVVAMLDNIPTQEQAPPSIPGNAIPSDAAAPQQLPAPAPTPRAMQPINISGSWRGPDGVYVFQQSGNNVAFQLFTWNQMVIAQGNGTITQNAVAIRFARIDNTGGEARLQVSADGSQMSGVYTNLVTGERGAISLIR